MGPNEHNAPEERYALSCHALSVTIWKQHR
jgi:hypothetical protein